MAVDADEASSALIAKLLSEDGYEGSVVNPSGYYDDFGEDSFDEEEEERKRKRKRRKKKKPKEEKAPKKPKVAAKPKATASKERKRAAPRAWSEEEEKLFVESLELYGRDWKQCAQHIKTREAKAVSSHCQKYFIKLYKENKPLPAKVRESGEGYTLSGKPLDPNSAAARAYGLKGAEASREYRYQMASGRAEKEKKSAYFKEEQGADTGDSSGARARNDELLAKAKEEGVKLRQVTTSRKPKSIGLADLIRDGHIQPGKGVIQMSYQDTSFHADLLQDGTLEFNGTKYDSLSGFSIAMKRSVNPDKQADCGWKSCRYNDTSLETLKQQYLGSSPKTAQNSVAVPSAKSASESKRQAALEARKRKAEQWAKRQAQHQHLYDENGQTAYSRSRSRRTATTRFVAAPSSALTFVRCSAYHGEPGTGDPLCQPFKVVVHSNVYALVDVHAHLSTAEVMGFLAGHWDAEKRTITVCEALPGKSMVDGATECEMDPVVEVDLRAEIEEKGYKVVGWYHSHPTFQAIPSSCDIDNQANYQALFRDASTRSEPFLGLIDSPYDENDPSDKSRFSWFYVASANVKKQPKHISTTLLRDTELEEDVLSRMVSLIKDKNQQSSRAINFSDTWADVPGAGALTYAEKFQRSVALWLPRKGKENKQEADTTILDSLVSALNGK